MWKWALKGCETAESETAETARVVVVDVQRSTSETAETARAVVVDVQMPTSETAETASRFDSFRIGAQSSLPCWKLYSQGFWRRAVSAVSAVSDGLLLDFGQVTRRCPNATSLSQVRDSASSTASEPHPSASGSHLRAAVSRAASESA